MPQAPPADGAVVDRQALLGRNGPGGVHRGRPWWCVGRVRAGAPQRRPVAHGAAPPAQLHRPGERPVSRARSGAGRLYRGAVDMVAAADCRYGTEDSFVCIQEINIAMTADVGTLQRLGRLVPEGVAREWAYTGDRIPAGRVREVGFSTRPLPTMKRSSPACSKSHGVSPPSRRWRSGAPKRPSAMPGTTPLPTPCIRWPGGSRACSSLAT